MCCIKIHRASKKETLCIGEGNVPLKFTKSFPIVDTIKDGCIALKFTELPKRRNYRRGNCSIKIYRKLPNSRHTTYSIGGSIKITESFP